MVDGFLFGLGAGVGCLVLAVLGYAAYAVLRRRWSTEEGEQMPEEPVELDAPGDDPRPEWMRRRRYDPYAGYEPRRGKRSSSES